MNTVETKLKWIVQTCRNNWIHSFHASKCPVKTAIHKWITLQPFHCLEILKSFHPKYLTSVFSQGVDELAKV